jgi:hypothetical protein
LRLAVWTGVPRDTRPAADVHELKFLQCKSSADALFLQQFRDLICVIGARVSSLVDDLEMTWRRPLAAWYALAADIDDAATA